MKTCVFCVVLALMLLRIGLLVREGRRVQRENDTDADISLSLTAWINGPAPTSSGSGTGGGGGLSSDTLDRAPAYTFQVGADGFIGGGGLGQNELGAFRLVQTASGGDSAQTDEWGLRFFDRAFNVCLGLLLAVVLILCFGLDLQFTVVAVALMWVWTEP